MKLQRRKPRRVTIRRMNKKGAGPSLTWIIMGIASLIAVFWLFSLMYTDFLTANSYANSGNSPLNPTYLNASNLIGGPNTTSVNALNELTMKATNKDSISGFFGGAVTGAFSTIVMGITALLSLLLLPAIISDVFGIISKTLLIPEPLIWLFGIVAGIYVAMKTIQALRGTIIEA
jgi:hypothetical protein